MKKYILTALIALTVVGCNAKKDSARTATVNRTGYGFTNGNTGYGNTCAQNQSPIGTIYGQSSSQPSLYDGGSFEANVKSFLSATVDPNEVGQISSGPSDQTGVRFQGAIKLDQNGNVVLSSSRVLIKVYDSYMLQNSSLQAIPIEITQAAAGQFNMQTGVGYVVFRDQYGEVRFDGKLDAQYFSGTVSYRNYTSVISQSPAQGQLGQFYVARCGIIQ